MEKMHCACAAPKDVSKLSFKEIALRGLWKENPGLSQLLGLCPLLAVTTSAANALGLGLATIVVLCFSSLLISCMHRFIMQEVRIPIYVVVIASLVTVVSFEVEAYFPALYAQLGIYLALITTNCIIMGRAEAFAGRHNPIRSLADAVFCGIGFTLVMFVIGSIREIIGNGTWFMGAHDLLGSWAGVLECTIYPAQYVYLIGILPPGGFFVLAILIGIKNALEQSRKRREEQRYIIKSEVI